MSKISDRWYLLLWAVFALAVLSARVTFNGDGARHVGYIMTHSAPALGEARWLLFPSFLFCLLRPLYLLGLIHTTEGALIPFGLASVIASVIYLGALRSWLESQQIEKTRRWIALAAASVCPSFLFYATDTAEPLFAATFCAVGLAVLSRTRRLPFGVLLMSLGLLLHQAVFVAFFLIPMAVGREELRDRREIGRTVLVVGSVVAVLLGILIVANHIGLGEALRRVFQVYRNPIHMNWMRGGPLKGLAVTLVGGFPQALVNVPGMHGLREIITGLRHFQWRAVAQALRLGFGFLLVASGAVFAFRRRRWEWLIALVGFSILPIVWNNLYGYLKFYVLFPLLVAHVIARVSPRISLAMVGILALLNVSALVSDVKDGRDRAAVRKKQYQLADANTRWITSGWEPDLPYLWPGRRCGMLHMLAKPSEAKTVEALRLERTGEYMECVQEAFCSGHPVWTDDWLKANAEPIGNIATYHGLPTQFLDMTWWRGPEDGQVLDPDGGWPLYVYSVGRQAEICKDLREHPLH